MPRVPPQAVRDNLEKCRLAAVAAVEVYNRPGPRFRTAIYTVLITISWTALFHAIFYKRKIKPWHRVPGTTGRGTRYIRIEGEPKHWELAECIKQYFGTENPAQRKNLEFLIGLRNRIEHRHLPELDPALYGECQAALLNLEDMLTSEFGPEFALEEQLAVSLQFSRAVPDDKGKAAKKLVGSAAKSVKEFVEKFRGELPGPILSDSKYSFSVFLIPKVANRESVADAVVEFVKFDQASADDLAQLNNINVLIKEKRVPVQNQGLLKPSEVVAALKARGLDVTMFVHTRAWKHFGVRPAGTDDHPERTVARFCVYDRAHRDYVYTTQWVDHLATVLADVEGYQRIVGHG